MRAQFEPLTIAGYSYDPRTVAAPLEALMLRAAIAGRGTRDASVAAVLLFDSRRCCTTGRTRSASSAVPLRS